MKTIKASSIIAAQVLNIDFAASANSYVVNCVSKQSDGGYKVHDPIWTNSSQQPVFTSGQSVNLIPVKGNDGKTRHQVLPV